MRNWKSAVLFVAAMFGGAATAFAAITLQVDKVFDTAAYSVPGKEQVVAWNVTVKNTGTSPTGPVWLLGGTWVRDWQETAKFDKCYFPGVYGSCISSPLSPTFISSRIPGLGVGASFKFVASFKSPVQRLNGRFDSTGTDFVNFAAAIFTSGVPRITLDLRNQVALVAATDTQVSGVCPATGCDVFTGANSGIPTATDPFTTEWVIPGGTPTTFSITEVRQSVCDSANFTECWITFDQIKRADGVTIFNPPLTLFLRQHISTIKSACEGEFCLPNPADIVVFYVNGETTREVADCTGGEGGDALGEGQNECVPSGGKRYVFDEFENVLYFEAKVLTNHDPGWGLR